VYFVTHYGSLQTPEVLNRFHAIYMVLLQTFLNGESWEDLTDISSKYSILTSDTNLKWILQYNIYSGSEHLRCSTPASIVRWRSKALWTSSEHRAIQETTLPQRRTQQDEDRTVMHLLNTYSADQDNYQDALTNLRLRGRHGTSNFLEEAFSTEDHQQTSMWQTL
jgi:hypothetical protein